MHATKTDNMIVDSQLLDAAVDQLSTPGMTFWMVVCGMYISHLLDVSVLLYRPDWHGEAVRGLAF